MGSLKAAVARDEAFCFYYVENFREFERAGIEPVFFSPLRQEKLPQDVSGLYIGGGYPELHAEVLAANKNMLVDINQKVTKGMPVIAECGGFMYLNKGIETADGRIHKACGIFEDTCKGKGKLVRFGYVEIEDSTGKWLPEGKRIRGHEFHYFDTDNNGSGAIVKKASGKKVYREIHITDTVWAGWPHLYFRSAPGFAKIFADKCMVYKGIS